MNYKPVSICVVCIHMQCSQTYIGVGIGAHEHVEECSSCSQFVEFGNRKKRGGSCMVEPLLCQEGYRGKFGDELTNERGSKLFRS